MKIKISMILLLMVLIVRAEDITPKNQIYLELLGNGVLYSANYERYITNNFTVRGGASAWSIDSQGEMIGMNMNVTVFPMTLNWLFGKTEHKTELGAGINIFFVDDKDDNDKYSSIVPTGIIGYRYFYNNSWVFRAAITPFLNPDTKKIIPSIGMSYGIMF